MKRWQDRGEVQDSDDEDIGLSNESQSPEQGRKRPRLDAGPAGHAGSSETRHDKDNSVKYGANDDAEKADEPWLQPNFATTYGRKVKSVAITVPRVAPVSPRIPDGLSSASVPRSPSQTGQEPHQRGPTVSSQISPVLAEDDPFARPGSSLSTDSTGLPSASQLLTGGRSRETGELAERQPYDRSATSSPLSEREVSPPPGFRLPGAGTYAAPPTATADPPGCGDPLATDHAVAAELLLGESIVAAGGRQLRARKEKQLHPYQYDKTLYQQQWRQRGLRPVHFTLLDVTTETQDQSYSGDESQSQKHVSNKSSSPPRPMSASGSAVSAEDGTEPRAFSQTQIGEDEFPDIDTLLNQRPSAGVQDGRKRRKLFHLPRDRLPNVTDNPGSALPGMNPDLDEFSVPPSPPPTSSDSAQQARPRQTPLPSGFRLPAGMRPGPLPTPQVSSDIRPSRKVASKSGSDSDSIPRRSRPSTVSRPPPRALLVESSSDSEVESSSEPEDDERRLQRERKRIRGVLPASWLKIDMRAQQRKASPSPERWRRPSTISPPPSARPQKGVAQRVSRGSAIPGTAAQITISDDENESDNASVASHHLQSPLRASRDILGLRPANEVDIDAMEVDWIDPMLAGHSRSARQRDTGKKRQPRIKDAFTRVRSERDGFSEERVGIKHALGSTNGRVRSTNPKARGPQRTKPSAPPLSILDAPSGPTTMDAPVPQFVRLAQRQARRQTGHGRHSPSRKVIRLATKQDTEEATAMLSAWREGTIVPKEVRAPAQGITGVHAATTTDAVTLNEPSSPTRDALTETSENRQPQMPPSVLKGVGVKAQGPDRRIVVRRPRLRQTRLQPTLVDTQSPQTDAVAAQQGLSEGGNFDTSSVPPLRRRPHLQPKAGRLRGAQIETLENAFDQEHRTSAFECRINCLTECVAARARRQTSQALPLERYLDGAHSFVEGPATTKTHAPKRIERAGNHVQAQSRTHLPYRPRKGPPQRVDVEARQYRQPSEPLPDHNVAELPHADLQSTSGPVLHGLGGFGTRYPIDFDVQPIALGTYFHQSTFIGSGDFAASLKLTDRDLSVITGRMRVHVGDEVLEWGAWTEEVAAGIARIIKTVAEALLTLDGPAAGSQSTDQLAIVTSNIDHMLRSAVRYCSRCLAFLDLVDRRPCVQHLLRFVEDLLEATDAQQADGDVRRRLNRRCLQYALVVAAQAHQLSQHSLVPLETSSRVRDLLAVTARKLAGHILWPSLDALSASYEDNRHSSKREAGIREDDGDIAGIVILHHCLRNASLPQTTFWTVVNGTLDVEATKLDSVSAFDMLWYKLHTLLPALEIDKGGIARPGSRLCETQQDWTLVKQLIDRLFELYPATSALRGSTINDYVRATFTRCYRLVTRWGWWKCEPILGAMFDFFARRSLAPLNNEDHRSSPQFLGELSGQPSVEAQPEDRSFHIFLKTLVVGLHGMRKDDRYSDKKIGGIAWRFIPNHGRTYRRDVDVRQSALDALRNHHDLLCTLYYASPRGHRLRLDLLRGLVDHSTSHREACRLSVRSWSNLASFQASTDEPVEAMQPFVEWFHDILQTTISQYRLAKTEAEHDFAVAKAQGATGITESVLTATINSNQRQIAATLVDALSGLKRALMSARALPAAVTLVEGSRFWSVFHPFDASERRLNTALQEALDVIATALAVQHSLSAGSESQQASEESQDYGDSSALQEFAAFQHHVTGTQATIGDLLYEPVGQLVSNVFGADQIIDDTMLAKIVDTWVQLARESVRSGKRSWASYLDDYSQNSWCQLRDTEHRRRLTPYFLACMVNRADHDLEDFKTSVLCSWLVSLVDREAMLKYQHELTTAVLNNLGGEPLLNNLPFEKDGATAKFNAGLTELRQRRLALVSSVLSNMRMEFDETLYNHPRKIPELRRTYTDMLRSAMQAMKSNYQELQASPSVSVADPSVHGTYVEFVQHVVSFLQEHTADICRVDPYFTDSSAFPLPATDPTYVVGRLRGYVPKLVESKTRKQLVVFIHAVSERAAVDGQQQYLVDQLCSATDGVLERGSSTAPSLRHVMLTAIFPTYFENAFSTACSWILAVPLLRACKRVLGGLQYNVRLEDDQSVRGVNETVGAVLNSTHKSLELALMHLGLLRLPHVQNVLGNMFECSQSVLTLINHVSRSTKRGEEGVKLLRGLYMRGRAVLAHLRDEQEELFDPLAHEAATQGALWAETKAFARQHCEDALTNYWHAHDGQYFVRRGNSSKEVVVALKDEEEERQLMLASIERFCRSFEAITDGQARIRTAALRDGCGMGGIMV